MEQTTKLPDWLRARNQRLLLENYALLTESASDLRARLDEWFQFYQPATPGECELLELAVMSSVQRSRVLSHRTEVTNHHIRTADFDFDCAREDEVERYRAMLQTSPGAAILGLKRSALGVRLLISRWERLERLLLEEGTLYGEDRNEMINCQGARAVPTESLSQSAGAYLTWLYCLICQPAPKDKDFVAIGNECWTPVALYARDPYDWMGEQPVCRRILETLVARELASLRQREAVLRTNYEVPARDGAELRRQVLVNAEGALLLRHERAHAQVYQRAYETFLKGRALSLKTGRLPGAPEEGAEYEPAPAAKPDAPTVAEGRAGRKRAAEAVAPGPGNGIGEQDNWGDPMRAEVTKARGEAAEPPAEAPIEPAESFAT